MTGKPYLGEADAGNLPAAADAILDHFLRMCQGDRALAHMAQGRDHPDEQEDPLKSWPQPISRVAGAVRRKWSPRSS